MRLLSAIAGAILLVAPAATAQPVYPAQSTYYGPSYQTVQTLAQHLDVLAQRARADAKYARHNGGSEEVAERIDDFAHHANQFRALVRRGHVSDDKINDQIRRLVDDARKVQKESAKHSWRNAQLESDWNACLSALDNLNAQYLAANRLAPAPLDVPGYQPVVRPGYGEVGTSGRVLTHRWADDRDVLLQDLDRRADDAVRLSRDSYADAAPDLIRLRDQVRAFRDQADRLRLEDSRANILHLLADARAAQADLANEDAPPQLRDDINAMVGTLVQMRDMTADRAEGTSGRVEPGIANDRFAMMDAPQLAAELNRRTDRAVEISNQYDLDSDTSSQISHFSDRLRDFNQNAATMDRDDRRSGLDSLLKDAQQAQRSLARRNAPVDLTNQWNAIVDLLVRLRDAS